jgi:hypothetical protein
MGSRQTRWVIRPPRRRDALTEAIAIVEQAGRTPVYGDFKEPAPVAGESRIAVTAAALSPVVRARASGTHYSSSGASLLAWE